MRSEAAAGLSPANLRRAADRFGTPLYVYDLEAVEAQARRLRAVLPEPFELAYAVKANPSLAVLSSLARLGLGADVASRGELAAALAAGFPATRILATGPAKSDADLRALTRAGVRRIHVEGLHELEALEEIARRLRRVVRVGFRLNPPWGIAEKRTIIGGPGAKKFGFDLASARRALSERGRFPHLLVSGFQVFNASNVLSARLLVENVRNVLELAATLSRRCDVPLETVDFGGGLGVPYADGERPLDVAGLGSGLREIAAEIAHERRLHGTRLVFEPGRFLVAESGRYVVRVLGTKRSRGVDYVLVDGGVHHLLRPALIGTPHRVELVPQGRAHGRAKSRVIGGPLCTSLDVLHPKARLMEPLRGDLLAFENAGAYGYTESMPLFLSHEWAAEVGVRGRRMSLLRRPPKAEDLLRAQRRRFF